MSDITIPRSMIREFVDEARAQLVTELIDAHREEVQMLSPAQVCGILDINPATLTKTAIPRVVLAPKMIRYRLVDVKEFIAASIEE
jgi:hypothetical protein